MLLVLLLFSVCWCFSNADHALITCALALCCRFQIPNRDRVFLHIISKNNHIMMALVYVFALDYQMINLIFTVKSS